MKPDSPTHKAMREASRSSFDSTTVALAPLEPKAGEVACREWWTREGHVEIRHVLIVAAIRPHPYVVRVYAGRGNQPPRVKRYGIWQKTIKEQLQTALAVNGIAPFEKDYYLGTAISSAARPGSPPDARLRKDGFVDRRYIKNVMDWDRTDLDKAIEDACNTILWHDDKQVRATGPGAHFAQTGDAFAIHTWGAVNNFVLWNPDWNNTGFSVPFTYKWLALV